jgi:NAD(P)-dependent dehydrogenase (short-subunit alcohol dehydrogenase family)
MGPKGRVLAVKTDVTRRGSVDAMVAKAHREFGPVEILVNNAGGVANRCQAVAEDIAHLALFLASDVSGYITGQLISVSGGAYMP